MGETGEGACFGLQQGRQRVTAESGLEQELARNRKDVLKNVFKESSADARYKRVYTGALGTESERQLVVKEANSSRRTGEGWKITTPNTTALGEKSAMSLRKAEKLEPSAFKSATH